MSFLTFKSSVLSKLNKNISKSNISKSKVSTLDDWAYDKRDQVASGESSQLKSRGTEWLQVMEKTEINFIWVIILNLEKEMATHSSTLAWKIPWTEDPSRLQSMGSQRVGHNWATLLLLFEFEL